MTEDELRGAHKHCTNNRATIAQSEFCSCFYCLGGFAPELIDQWLNEGEGTAIYPLCRIDSVIGDGSGLPVDDRSFLVSMHECWFERSVSLDKVKAAFN